MNIPFMGPNLGFTAKIDPSDGMLDVVLIKEAQRKQLDAHLAKRMTDQEASAKPLVIRGHEIEIEFDSAPASLDDGLWPDKKTKTMRGVKKVLITVQPGALHVLSGANA